MDDENNHYEPYRSFEVHKSYNTSSGLAEVFTFIPTGGTARTSTPSYHTSHTTSAKQRFGLPTPFDIYHGAEASLPEKVARVNYKGWEDIWTLRCAIDLYLRDTELNFDPDIPDIDDSKSHISITRKGTGRDYEVHVTGSHERTFRWEGSKSALALVNHDSPTCNGNLKMFELSNPEKILAVWKNRTDFRRMGSLVVLAELDEGELLEECVFSCLAIVLAERVTLRGWLGGIGKGKNKLKDRETFNERDLPGASDGMPSGRHPCLSVQPLRRGTANF